MIFTSNFASGFPALQDALPTVVGLIVALLGVGGLTALIKSKPEGSKILIDAAAGVVVVQTGVITDLREQLEQERFRSDQQDRQLKESQVQIDELRSHVAEMSLLRRENDQLKVRVSDQELEIQVLRSRVAELEQHNKTS